MRQSADPAAAERAALEAAFATGRPFTGLRGHRHDPALDAVVPPALARRLRIVPLALQDGVLRVAVADPRVDAAALSARLGGRPVAVTLASAAEVDDLLGPQPATGPWQFAAVVAAVLAVALAIVPLATTTGDDEQPSERAGKATQAVADPAQPAPHPPPRPLTVAVTGDGLPRALRAAWPSDTASHPASSRADALAALCTGTADLAVLLDAPPTGAERTDAGCAVATAAEVTVAATVLRAPRGGCVRERYAVNRARNPGRRPQGRLRDVAVRDGDGHCIRPTPGNIRSGAYPLTHRVALVTGPAGAPAALPPADRIGPRVTTITLRRLR